MLKKTQTPNRAQWLLVSTALSFGTAMIADQAMAQTKAPVAADTNSDLVVTGTRVRRSRLDLIAPVDVIKAETITNQASSELAQGLSAAAPSIDFPRPAVTDGTDSVRPATLRGLSPDEALVLINGKRRHASSLVNINGSVGRGSAAVDLNTVPESALNGLEILETGRLHNMVQTRLPVLSIFNCVKRIMAAI